MKAKLLSTNVCVFIFACLLCLTSSDKEGYFTISTSDKSWEFILNESPNAQILAKQLKEGPVTAIFIYYNYADCENYACNDYQFGFEEDETENHVEAYDIYGYGSKGDNYMEIILKKFDYSWDGTKMGYLIDGVNKLDEFDSSLCVGDKKDIGQCKVTFTLAYAERDIVEPETDIVEPETDIVEPETDIVEPKTDIVEPETDIVEPETDIVEPEVPKFSLAGRVVGRNYSAWYNCSYICLILLI